jgi:hypothetical protein
MAFNFQPTGQQTMSMREVDQFLQEARSAPRSKNPIVLGLNMLKMMRAKNNGYPKHMYHATYDMRVVTKEEEETALIQIGYSETYIARDYPKAMFRRNMAAKFEPKFDLATGVQLAASWVEEIVVRNEQQEKELRLMKPHQGQSIWFDKITDLPAIEEAPDEDPAVTIARLQGQLSAMQRPSDKPTKAA